jgi:hypothetical protein
MPNPTLPNADELEAVAGKWLLMKRGLYWMPNSQGYTGLKSEAGRYTDEEVAIYRRPDEREVFVLDAETADEIAPKCWPDVAQRHLAGLLSSAQAQIERLTRERDARTDADNALVDKYRDPQHGTFNFPGDVAAIVRRLEAAEAEVKRLREALEHISSPSQTTGLLWWQIAARTALSGGTSNG